MPAEIPEQVARLLNSIETEDRLEVLCLLRATKPKTFSARTVAKELSISSASAESALAMLCGRGFLTVSIATDLFYSYAPASSSIEEAVNELVKFLEADRAAVLSALGSRKPKSTAHTFANAFLLRRRKEDDDG